MATFRDKLNIIIGAQDKSTGVLSAITSKVGQMVTAFTAANLITQGLAAAGRALKKSFDALISAVNVAARIEVLNGVLEMTAVNAGLATEEIQLHAKAVQKLGIAEKESLEILQRFIQVNLDVADATKIARVAQDLAVIAGTNSSETAKRLTEAIVKQRPILLKQFGIVANLNEIYGKMAKTVGKTVDTLTDTEKRTAFLNTILEKGARVAGAYETAMGFAGKQLTSLPRHLQAAQEAIGRHFLPAMSLAIIAAGNFLKALTAIFGKDTAAEEEHLEKALQAKADALNILLDRMESGTVTLKAFMRELENIRAGDIGGFEKFADEVLRLENMDKIVNDASRLNDEFVKISGFELPEDFNVLTATEQWRKVEKRVRAFEQSLVAASFAGFQLTPLKQIVIDLDAELERMGNRKPEKIFKRLKPIYKSGLDDLLEETRKEKAAELEIWQAKAEEMIGIGQDAVHGIVDEFISGRKRLGDVFKGMAIDFLHFFVEQVLQGIASKMVPGVVGLLTSIFDNPINDQKAATQGRHYAQFFTQGALHEFNRSSLGDLVSGAVNPAFRQFSTGNEMTFVNPIFTREFTRSIRAELERESRTRTLTFGGGRITSLVGGEIGL